MRILLLILICLSFNSIIAQTTAVMTPHGIVSKIDSEVVEDTLSAECIMRLNSMESVIFSSTDLGDKILINFDNNTIGFYYYDAEKDSVTVDLTGTIDVLVIQEIKTDLN